MNIALVTLGCAKNQVDSEVMLGLLKNQGYSLVKDLESADVVVINTCGFLQSAVDESIDAILDAASRKEKGRVKRIVVAGCLVERFKEGLKEALPEVDALISVNQIPSVAQVAAGVSPHTRRISEKPSFLYDDRMPRIVDASAGSAYIKISDGCDRRCAFCIVPVLRGPMRSRSMDSVLREAEQLSASGIREINLVAQDLTSFGRDRGEGDLSTLLRALDAQNENRWVRLLYAYPAGITEPLLTSIVELPSVCEYLDIPLQHVSEAVLKRMRRPSGRFASRPLVEFIKKKAPSIALRTTFIVGFPGETEDNVAELEAFIREGHFACVGVFTYSPEEGTSAFKLEGGVGETEKEERRNRIMLAQQRVVERF